MGIDVFLSWDGMTKEDREKQYTGFDTTMGRVGYLREAYHGGPYATRLMLPEAFAADEQDCPEHTGRKGCHDYPFWGEEKHEGCECIERGVHIPTDVLIGRLEETCETVIRRAKEVYKEDIGPDDPTVKSFIDFVRLAEKLEREGKETFIYASF